MLQNLKKECVIWEVFAILQKKRFLQRAMRLRRLQFKQTIFIF